MVVAANDVADAHVVIVHHHREIIGGRAVGARDDEIVELGIRHRHLALHHVLYGGGAVALRLEADHRLYIFRRRRRVAVAPAPVIAHRAALRFRLGAHGVELGRRRIAEISVARRQQSARYFGVAVPVA